MHDHRFLHTNCTQLPVSILGVLIGGLLGTPLAHSQTLQDDIDLASPGDTVWIAPGDYVRGVTVDKAITLAPQTPGTVRLAGLTGSAATVTGITFDGTLDSRVTTLITCGSGLTVMNCSFGGTIRGALVQTGAQDVGFTGSTFTSLIEGIRLEDDVASLSLDQTDFVDCSLGFIGPDTLVCEAVPRKAAERCAGLCGTLALTNVSFQGGSRHITLFGDYRLSISSTQFDQPAEWAISAGGIHLEIEDCDLVSVGGAGLGLNLVSVSGHIRTSKILSWDVALRIGDGSCPLYSDVVVGGALKDANDIGSQTLGLDLDQPEAVNAEFNFWGSQSCSAVHSMMDGQTVDTITDANHTQTFDCSGTPVTPATWGSIKTRFSEPYSTDQP